MTTPLCETRTDTESQTTPPTHKSPSSSPSEDLSRNNSLLQLPTQPPRCPSISSLPAPAPAPSPTPKPTSRLPSYLKSLKLLLTYTPPPARYCSTSPPQFSLSLNILFAIAAGFTVANLYYNHPILNILAADFDVDYEDVAQIPTVMQAGYAAGLLFLCPLGDLVPRRGFVVGLVGGTAALWLILCLTPSLPVFTAISFLAAITTVTPQLMLPLVGDLAPPNRRAAALSIVVSGLMLGVLLARTLSGTITNYTSWRVVYWIAFALQVLIFTLLYIFMPAYPSTNPTGLTYWTILYDIPKMLLRHPVLAQACITSFFTSATFTAFWTTLTFLLAGAPYFYPPLHIGLFGLIGIAAMILSPLYARTVTDRFVPHFSVLFGLCISVCGISIGTFVGEHHLAGPIVQALFLDFGIQTAQIANRSAIYGVEPKRRNGVNTAFMVATFCGQLMGTSAGSRAYARGGWKGSGGLALGCSVFAVLTMVARGPWEKGWVGWGGGWGFRKRVDARDGDGRWWGREWRRGRSGRGCGDG
ncbi:MFS general substrate transporter [Sporormia fimetaria CBS 119925]|uniref:MFS general substrate transporter n=1 Tax=Sporormia fimetaria CBS 119925 TaxID=1340428 RepID=A0A6A6V3W6_9PLEO|nr:MFS general substrate transporter [Sporormia fimetaria CBS 119925]